MKTIVKIVTVIAVLMIMVGGSALDSQNMIPPMLMIFPGFVWLGLLAWANKV